MPPALPTLALFTGKAPTPLVLLPSMPRPEPPLGGGRPPVLPSMALLAVRGPAVLPIVPAVPTSRTFITYTDRQAEDVSNIHHTVPIHIQRQGTILCEHSYKQSHTHSTCAGGTLKAALVALSPKYWFNKLFSSAFCLVSSSTSEMDCARRVSRFTSVFASSSFSTKK